MGNDFTLQTRLELDARCPAVLLRTLKPDGKLSDIRKPFRDGGDIFQHMPLDGTRLFHPMPTDFDIHSMSPRKNCHTCTQ